MRADFFDKGRKPAVSEFWVLREPVRVEICSDLDAYRAVVRRSRALGFEGSSAIHPDQVRILNEEFTPAAADVARARALVAAARAATQGAFAFEGKMVDKPIIERAELLIRRAEAIAARAGG